MSDTYRNKTIMNQCPKCESKRSHHYGSTQFYSIKWCFDCGNKWRDDFEPPYLAIGMLDWKEHETTDSEVLEWERKKRTLRPYELPSITT